MEVVKLLTEVLPEYHSHLGIKNGIICMSQISNVNHKFLRSTAEKHFTLKRKEIQNKLYCNFASLFRINSKILL